MKTPLFDPNDIILEIPEIPTNKDEKQNKKRKSEKGL